VWKVVVNQDTTSRQLGAMRVEIIALQQELMQYRLVSLLITVKKNYLQKLDLGAFPSNHGNRIRNTRMWANAQRDGHPAEFRWCPLFNAAKSDWCPLLECRAVMLPRHETHWNELGCPKLPNRSQPLVDWSSPYCGDICSRYWCLTSFFRLFIHALVAKIQPTKMCNGA